MKGAIRAQSGSVRSLAYLSSTRACRRRGRVSSVQAIVISVQLCNRTEAQPAELTRLVSNRALRLPPPFRRAAEPPLRRLLRTGGRSGGGAVARLRRRSSVPGPRDAGLHAHLAALGVFGIAAVCDLPGNRG